VAQVTRGAARVARALSGAAQCASRGAERAKYSARLSLPDIDMHLWIRHLSLTAAPRRHYPDL